MPRPEQPFTSTGRHLAHPNGGDPYFLGGRPLYNISFTGSGTYSKVESSSGDGEETVTETRSAQFQWAGTWGVGHKNAVPLDENPYNASQFSVSGTTSYSGTGKGSCTGSLNANGASTLQLLAGRRGMWMFSFDLGITDASSADPNCTFAPQDPSADIPESDPITLDASYHAEAVRGRGVDSGNAIFLPFTLTPSFHHHVHTSPSADNPGYSADEDLAISGAAHFTLIGLSP
jgi:hypothetical protein